MRREQGLSKEAMLHAQADTRNIPDTRSLAQNVVQHAQADMVALTPQQPGLDEKQRGFFDKIADSIGQAWSDMHIGKSHAKAMFKLGAHELTQTLAAFPDSNIRPMEEPGAFLNEQMPHIQDYGHHEQRGQDRDPSRTR